MINPAHFLRPLASCALSAGLLLGVAVASPAAADATTSATASSLSLPRAVPDTVSSVRLTSAAGVQIAGADDYAVEKKLTPNAIALHRASLVAWPQIKTYYGYRNSPGSDHYTGKALDLMVPSYKTRTGRLLGRHVAIWARDNATELRISYVIWNQHIWSVQRASEGWRLMADRGSDSANHMNHVHLSVK